MSNRSYACFACREVRRKPEPLEHGSVACPTCGLKMENIGYKLRVPPKINRKAWGEFEKFFRAELENTLIAKQKQIEERKNQVRSEIEVMHRRPLTKGRGDLIERLEVELKGLIGAR